MEQITRLDRGKYDVKGLWSSRQEFFYDLTNFQSKGKRHWRTALIYAFLGAFDILVFLILLLTGQVWWLWAASLCIFVMFVIRFVAETRFFFAYNDAVTEDMCWYFDETGQPEKKREYLERLQ